MTEFTVESAGIKIDDIDDKDLRKKIERWDQNLKIVERQLEELSKYFETVISDAKAIMKDGEKRLKDTGISKEEKKALESVIDHAADIRKKVGRMDVL